MTTASLAVTPAPPPLERRSAKPSASPPEIAEQIRKNGSVCLRVQGMSMFPWIHPGDLVFVRRCGFAMVKPGDVILFEQGERYFVHRVLETASASGAVITKGDAQDGADAPALPEQFLGRAIRIHRGRRHIDLESPGLVVLGRFLAKVSRLSPLVYRPLRVGRRFFSRLQSA